MHPPSDFAASAAADGAAARRDQRRGRSSSPSPVPAAADSLQQPQDGAAPPQRLSDLARLSAPLSPSVRERVLAFSSQQPPAQRVPSGPSRRTSAPHAAAVHRTTAAVASGGDVAALGNSSISASGPRCATAAAPLVVPAAPPGFVDDVSQQHQPGSPVSGGAPPVSGGARSLSRSLSSPSVAPDADDDVAGVADDGDLLDSARFGRCRICLDGLGETDMEVRLADALMLPSLVGTDRSATNSPVLTAKRPGPSFNHRRLARQCSSTVTAGATTQPHIANASRRGSQ